MEYAVETRGLCKDFGAFRAVDKVDLLVERGAFYGFLGPNGAGKSTTIKILTGLLAPGGGEARVLGYNVERSPLPVKRRIGVVSEELCLFENLRGHEYLAFVGRMYRLPRSVAQKRTGELLELLELDTAGKTLIAGYSHGMKKKLSVAAALIHEPELLFLDEPFEGVDAIASRAIRQVLERMVSRGATIFLTSHVLEIVERLCTHVGIVARGRLVRQGLLAEVAGAGSLEDAFIRAAGGARTTPELSWL